MAGRAVASGRALPHADRHRWLVDTATCGWHRRRRAHRPALSAGTAGAAQDDADDGERERLRGLASGEQAQRDEVLSKELAELNLPPRACAHVARARFQLASANLAKVSFEGSEQIKLNIRVFMVLLQCVSHRASERGLEEVTEPINRMRHVGLRGVVGPGQHDRILAQIDRRLLRPPPRFRGVNSIAIGAEPSRPASPCRATGRGTALGRQPSGPEARPPPIPTTTHPLDPPGSRPAGAL
jgi:hypothetical protein